MHSPQAKECNGKSSQDSLMSMIKLNVNKYYKNKYLISMKKAYTISKRRQTQLNCQTCYELWPWLFFRTIICILIRKKTLSSCFMRYPADLNKQKSCDLVVRNIQTLSWVFQEITSSFSFISWNNKPKRDQIYLLFFLNLIFYLNKILSFWSSKQMLRFKVSKIPPVKGHDYHLCILVDWYIN